MLSFSVNLWGSKPNTNDDCHTGADYENEVDAQAAYANPAAMSPYIKRVVESTASELWVELVGPGVRVERRLHAGRKAKADDTWRREAAMQAGMGLGIDAYNDEMGF